MAIPMMLTFEEIVLPVGIPGLIVLLAVVWRQKRSRLFCFASALFWFYLLALIRLTLFPIPIPGTLEGRRTIAMILSRINLIPLDFGGLFELHPNVIRHELCGNILLTIPFGLGLPFLSQIRARTVPWLAVTVGLAIETAQLLVSLAIGRAYRGVDINDVLLNATGVLIGYCLFRGIAWLYFLKRLS